jgi:glycosyltransferase involved in cell wall biosynthesis
MPPLTVCSAIYQFYPIVGGTERQAQALAGKLVEKGCQVKVLTARQSWHWPRRELLRLGTGQTDLYIEVLRLATLPIKGLRTLSYVISLAAYLVLHRHEYDVIHVHHAHLAAMVGVGVAVRAGKKTVCKIAGAGEAGDMAALRRLPFTRLWLHLLWRLDAVIAVSTALRQELLEHGFPPERIVSIPNGVNTTYFSPGDRASREEGEAPVILFIGNFTRPKGADILLRALALLRGRQGGGITWRLDLLGDGPDRSALRGLAEDLGIAASVRFMGLRSDVRDRMRDAALMVLPSRSEGLSNVLLEAMACGLPVVSTRVSGSVDVVEDSVNGLLVEPERPEELAGAIQLLLQDRALAQRLGRQARATVLEKYSLDTVAEQYIALYRWLLGESKWRVSLS